MHSSLVTGGLISLGAALFPALTNSSYQTPPEIPHSIPSPPKTPDQVPKPEPTPVSSCIAANVEKELTVYPQPDSNSSLTAYLSPREPATTTGMRQGDFVEISAPVKGWINEGNVIPCDSSPDKFDKAPKLIKDSSLAECVAADVETSLSIRSEPYLNAKVIGKILPREKATVTGMRQGNFIETSKPDKGWINKTYTVPCDTDPKNYKRAPETNKNNPGKIGSDPLPTYPPTDGSSPPVKPVSPPIVVEPPRDIPKNPSGPPFGTASKSWCLGMRDQWQFRKDNFGQDDQSIRASLQEQGCDYWGISISPTTSTPPSSQVPNPRFGTASKSWCLGMRDQWQFRKDNFGQDDQSIRASLQEQGCDAYGITIP